jgi:galactose-1-phosphate uridylyltransferase
VFQNWLKEAGASFDHLHKQLVGLDDWGLSIEKERDLVRNNPDIYNELVVNFAIYNNLVVAENKYAVAFSDIGHRYCTLAVYSKSRRCRPNELTEKALRGFSDLVHACHAAMGPHISCNEEWYYMPKDCMVAMPWHILIKWRTLTTAGFEGGTRIHINPTSPYRVRDIIIPALFALRDKRKIRTNIKIGKECACVPNCLKYHEK